MAAHLAWLLVRVVVERLVGVGDLKLAVAALDGAEQRGVDALAGDGVTVGEDGWPCLGAFVVADRVALRVLLEDVDRLALGVEEHLAELRVADRDRGALALGHGGVLVVLLHGRVLVVLLHGGVVGVLLLHRRILALLAGGGGRLVVAAASRYGQQCGDQEHRKHLHAAILPPDPYVGITNRTRVPASLSASQIRPP